MLAVPLHFINREPLTCYILNTSVTLKAKILNLSSSKSSNLLQKKFRLFSLLINNIKNKFNKIFDIN